MTVYAYLRISTLHQDVQGQRKRIEDLGFTIKDEDWFEDSGFSGSIEALKRPSFKKLISKVVEGDTIVVTEISRMGRSTSDVLTVIESLTKKGIHLRICNLDGISITSPTGRLMVTLMASCAQFERDLLRDRTVHGLNAARARGVQLGRPTTVSKESIVAMRNNGSTLKEIATKFDVSLRTVQRMVATK